MLVEKMPRSAGANHQTYPLTFANRGEWVQLAEIHAGDKLRKRLADLGLHVGMQVRVVQDDHAGPVILAVKNDSRLAVGRGMAQKILVHSAEGQV
ncbi:MAG: ferrous iron transport protein A [Anaerolineae bacterium]|nr:ferrous iron transport protein A [Anaerolineae bacterium]